MADKPKSARLNNKAYRRIRRRLEGTDEDRPKRQRYRRDEPKEWQPFELADIDHDPLP